MTETKKNENVKTVEADENVVYLVNGVGNDAIAYPWAEGDTVASILEKAKVKLKEGSTVTLGRENIRKPEKTSVKPGDTLVIAGKVSNG